MKNDYPIGKGSALDERRGPNDDSREILVKTPGNNSSLRLNAKLQAHPELTVWEVTLPFEQSLKLIKDNNRWVSFGKAKAAEELIGVIGRAIDEQLTV